MSDGGDRGIRTYVLRSGRMTDSQRRALESLWHRYGLEFDPSAKLDFPAAFGNSNPVVAEIGFGMGQATWRIAAERPDTNYLGLEVHAPGVGRLIYDLESRGIRNVRIFRHDAVEVFERMMAPDSLAGLHIFYPDPWPKKRHRKRRLIRDGLSGLLASRSPRRLSLFRHRHRGVRAMVPRRPLPDDGSAQPLRRLRAPAGLEARDQVRGPCLARRQGLVGAGLRARAHSKNDESLR